MTVARSADSAVRLDESQYSAGDGPCLTAIRQQAVVHVPDLINEHRWPSYSAAALEAGVGSSLSVPLVLEGEAEAGLTERMAFVRRACLDAVTVFEEEQRVFFLRVDLETSSAGICASRAGNLRSQA